MHHHPSVREGVGVSDYGEGNRVGARKRGGFLLITPPLTNVCSQVLFLCLVPKQRNPQPSFTLSSRLAGEPNCGQIEPPMGHLWDMLEF